MTFDETLQFLREQVGKWVEVSVALLVPGREEPVHLAGFWGQVDRISQSGARALPDAWYVWFAEQPTGPTPGEFRLDRELFEEADVHANVVEEAEDRTTTGSTWTLAIRQRYAVTTVEVYV
jgi:hypothetical protein